MSYFCSLEEAEGGRGRAATAKLLEQHPERGADFDIQWRGRKRGTGFIILFPVFGTAAEWQKSNQSSAKGWRFATANTTRLLTGWIGGAWIK